MYQLKKSMGVQVVLNEIEHDVTPKEVIEALKENGVSAKNVSNIINIKRAATTLRGRAGARQQS